MLGNLGLGEILIIVVLILVLFGPKKIPELAGTVGRYVTQFRRQMEEAQRAVIDPIRSDLNGIAGPLGGSTFGGQSSGGALGGAPPAPPVEYVFTPPPLTEEEERARQPKRLLD